MPGGAGRRSRPRASSRANLKRGLAPAIAIAIAALSQVTSTTLVGAQDAAAAHAGSASVAPTVSVDPGSRAEAPAAAGPGYITLLFGRTMFSIADNSCNELAGAVPLDQVAQDLRSRGLTATGVVVVGRTQTASRLCYAGSLYPTWADIDTLRDTYGWSFNSDGMTHNDITAMTTAQQYEESCGSLAYLAENGMTTADAFYAYGDNLRTTAIQTNTVSQCFDYARTYSGGANNRTTLIAPYFQKTNSMLGGACSDTALSCYRLNVNGKRYASPVAISNLLQVTADQWVVVQFYRMVTGASLSTTPSWDCTSPNWQDHWTSQTEMYCINDFNQAISTIPPSAVVTSPATVAAAWGRQVSNIAGQVIAQSTGKPVSGATVTWSGGTATTDTSGYYTLANVPPGVHSVSVSAPAQPAANATVSVTTGETAVQNFTLGAATLGTIAGSVTDSATHAPITGANVTCTCSLSPTTTGAGGGYTFQNITPSTGYSLDFTASDYASQETDNVAVSAGQTTTVNAQLTGVPGEISGNVVNAQTDNGVPATTVSCTCASGSTDTDSSGAYAFTNVTPGTYSMTFAASGFATTTVNDVVVAPAGNTTEDAELAPGGDIDGVVTDSTASGSPPIVGATVSCTCGSSTSTDAGGTYEFDDVASGTYALTFAASGYATQTITGVGVSSGAATAQNAALVEDGAVGGMVTNATTAAPIAGATVTCTCASVSTVTDGSGTYTFTGVGPGTVTVSVTATGFTGASNSVVVNAGSTATQNFALNASTHQVVFSDGFESGSLSAWTVTNGFGIEATILHSGSFAAQANTTTGATYARKNLPSTYTTRAFSEIFMRGAARFSFLRAKCASTAIRSSGVGS